MSKRLYIPGYSNNAVIQLIISCGVAFVLLHATKVILMMVDFTSLGIDHYIFSNIALPDILHYKTKFWTIFTYGWFHMGFWELASNMIWLYCFGSVVQMLVGYRQVIPLFFLSMVAGAIFYLLCQYIPGMAFSANGELLGAQAGIIGLAAASLTIAPKYRFYITEHLGIPLVVIVGIFTALMVMNTGLHLPLLMLLVGGIGMGMLYVKLLRSGRKPGEWMYDIFDWLNRTFSPNEQSLRQKRSQKRGKVISGMQAHTSTQKRIDDLLDKINQKGYNSLTAEEKEFLMQAGQENK